jgi:protein pelota
MKTYIYISFAFSLHIFYQFLEVINRKMKIINTDYRKGFVKLKMESLDDLWYLSHILEGNDVVSAITFRKIKLGEGDERKAKIIKKRLKLSINVEKIQFSNGADSLRVSGKINQGTDDIPAGEYHTLNIEQDSDISVQKDHEFMGFQIKKLKEASENKHSSILICVLDRDKAYFALLKKYGYELLSTLQGNVSKKQFEENNKSNFFSEITSQLNEYRGRYQLNKILIGCPNFWKTYVQKEIDKSDLKTITSYASCSADGENAIKEVLRRPEVKDILKDERFSQEITLVEDLLSKISREENVEYGFPQVKEASNLGAVEKLLVSDNLIQKMREKENYQELDELMKNVDASKGEINIISSDNEAGEKLDSLGGIAGFLRFKIH